MMTVRQKALVTGSKKSNKGKLLMDATCVSADITFPMDLKLLNNARERIIDVLHRHRGKSHKKPGTYRIKARKACLSVARSKRVGGMKLRKALRQQVGFSRRNLSSIERLSEAGQLTILNRRQSRDILVISELYRQPHVRQIKRGKAGSDTEFGAKLSVSLVNGYAFVDRTKWGLTSYKIC